MDIKRRKKSSSSIKGEESGGGESSTPKEKVPSVILEPDTKISRKYKGPPPLPVEPASIFPKHRIWSRMILVLGVLTVVYFTTNKTKDSIYADFKEDLRHGKGFDVKCTHQYTKELKQYPGITPNNCGRVVVDDILIHTKSFEKLVKQIIGKKFKNLPPAIVVIDIGKWTLNPYKEVGGPTEFVDLNNFIPATSDFIESYILLHRRVKQIIREHYKIDAEKFHLAEPSFITILSGNPETSVDYSSQITVDQELNNGSFHYSAKVFLSERPEKSKNEMAGGKFVFADKDNIHRVVYPKKGRAIVYTSGPENIYYAEPPTKGSLVLLTLGFTGNPKQAFRNRVFLEGK